MKPLELAKHFRSKVHIGDDDCIYGYVPYDKESVELTRNGKKFTEILRSESFLWDNVACLVEHSVSNWLGSTLENNLFLRNEQDGLYFRVKLQDTALARDVMEKVQQGKLRVSPAFECLEETEENGLRTIHRAHLLEISLVDSPAYPQTSACMAVPGHRRAIKDKYAGLRWTDEAEFKLNY
jgi:HK97 family phage prohead protease